MMLALARHSSNDLRQIASEQHEPMQKDHMAKTETQSERRARNNLPAP